MLITGLAALSVLLLVANWRLRRRLQYLTGQRHRKTDPGCRYWDFRETPGRLRGKSCHAGVADSVFEEAVRRGSA